MHLAGSLIAYPQTTFRKTPSMKVRLLAAAIAALLFSAQAEAQRQRSEALEITRATALRGALRDVPREDLEEALRGSPDMSINYALDAVGVATGVFGQATSLSRLGEAGVLSALAFFAPTEGPESWLSVFAWMPREDAPSPREAKVLFQEILFEALQATLPEHSLSVDDRTRRYAFINIEGPQCSPCEFRSQAWLSANPARVRAPQILGRYPAYRWGGQQANGSIGGYPLVEGLTVEERLQFFRQLSEHLPTWAYIYLPPHDMLTGFPMMINEGELLLFIEPAAANNG